MVILILKAMLWWYQTIALYLRLVKSVFDSPAEYALKVVHCQKWVRRKTPFLQASPVSLKMQDEYTIHPEALIFKFLI